MSANSGAWRPLLSGGAAEKAQDIARDIGDAVAKQRGDRLFHDPFELLLEGYLARSTGDETRVDGVVSNLSMLLENAHRFRSPWLFGGLAGVGWVTQHLLDLLSGMMEPDEDDPCAELDEVLRDAAQQQPETGRYELLYGLCGLGLYALERLPRPSARELLDTVVTRLAQRATRVEPGLTWFTPAEELPEWQRQVAPEGYYNLGAAHGTPGVALILGKAVSAGVQESLARELIDGLISWTLAQRQEKGDGSGFPAWVPKNRPRDGSGRQAWCYGGLGLTVALRNAALLAGDSRRADEMTELARMEARRDAATRGLNDACLCHGAGGNAHLFNRLYQSTGDETFLAVARNDFEDVLADYQPEKGVGGYLFWQQPNPAEPEKFAMLSDASFLSGSVGVGLTLLAASAPIEPNWDRLLAADLAPFSSTGRQAPAIEPK